MEVTPIASGPGNLASVKETEAETQKILELSQELKAVEEDQKDPDSALKVQNTAEGEANTPDKGNVIDTLA